MATGQQACVHCAKSKRRCDRQIPRCLRCRKKGLACSYPPTKPSCFVLSREEDAFGTENNGSPTNHTPQPSKVVRPSLDADCMVSAMALDPWSGFLNDRQAPAWFAAPDTWEIDNFVPAERPPPGAADLKYVRGKIDHWLGDWIENGSNPFIHARLYQHRLPQLIQDAYTTLACYLRRTAATEELIFRIIEDRSKRLVQDNKLGANAKAVRPDPLEHLARVQALLVYQNIGLFDGDIRLRHLAESHISIMNDWVNQMVLSARQVSCLGKYVVSGNHEQMTAELGPMNPSNWENLLWYSWILAESIRRTWLVASGVQGVYLNLQRAGAASCKGGMKFTARKGVWEADSAVDWETLCSRLNVGLIHIGEADTLSIRVALKDISEFAVVVLQSSWGSEKMRRWGLQAINSSGLVQHS